MGRAFGPAICTPHLVQKSWMYRHRHRVESNWTGNPGGVTFHLAPTNRPTARADLSAQLSLRPALDWDYYVEFCTATGWNSGLGNPGLRPPYLFIRRRVQLPGAGDRPAYLALIEVSTRPGESRTTIEASGNTRFDVELVDADGPIVRVRATKL